MKNSTERDRFEAGLLEVFGDKIIPVEQASRIIGQFKDGSFAMSQLGMSLYTNGYNLRGRSTQFPNGIVYRDGATIFGVGYFAKEGEKAGHLMIVAPRGGDLVTTVRGFIARVRAAGLTNSSVYVRHLSPVLRDQFLATGMEPIIADPWHPEAMEEDEQYPNRVFDLDSLITLCGDGDGWKIENLPFPEDAGYKTKNRLVHQRFKNFLERNGLRFYLEPYGYTPGEVVEAEHVVQEYFEARARRGGVVGSTPEDYFALIKEKPFGESGREYFSYKGWLEANGTRYPILFFAGERIADKKVALYATITLRFKECFEKAGWDMTGFTAISEYIWLEIFARLRRSGIRIVDAGGSETKGLDEQKRQLGGKVEKSHWVVCR